jgi:glycosyltransferase involved in cell wall biosynthesis
MLSAKRNSGGTFMISAVLQKMEPGASLSEDCLLYWRPAALDSDVYKIAITIPTFKRPEQLVDTLKSVADQARRHEAIIVVMENEAEQRAGAQAATRYFAAEGVAGIVLIAMRPGNCNAYNAGWQTVIEHFPKAAALAVIDDDETASPHWLDHLVATQISTQADMVGGPQQPVLPTGLTGKIHPVFRPAYNATGHVPILYSSGNVLIKRNVLEAMPFPFLEPAFNFTGGGDSDFYDRAKAKAFSFAWAAEAILFEPIPERRLQADWIRDRAYRNGALSTLIETRRHGGGMAAKLRVLTKSVALLALSPLRALVDLIRTRSLTEAHYRIQIAFGRMVGHFGAMHEQYRNPDKN